MNHEAHLKLMAPMSGPVLPIENVPDPVFSQKLMGNGIAIDPTSEVLLAPCPGTIVQLHPAHHAVSIATEAGAQILLHVGIDTVKLKGQGFKPKVKVGDKVKTGQPLIEFDADFLAQKAKSLITMMVLAEAPEHRLNQFPISSATGGRDVLLELDFEEDTTEPSVATDRQLRAESQPVHISLETGLHARPAALLVGIAKKYQAKIDVRKDGKTANAKSVVGLLGLEIALGDSVQFVADGQDAKAAVDELSAYLRDLTEQPHSAAPTSSTATQTSATRTAAPRDANTIIGVAASPGVAIGRVRQIRTPKFDIVENSKDSGSDTASEKARLANALKTAAEELQTLGQKMKTRTDASQAAIFGAHQELLEDPDLIELATQLIESGKTAAFAWNQATATHAERLAHLNNELMANRANDLRDVGQRVLRILVGASDSASISSTAPMGAETILIAENLTPSDTAQLDREKILGFCTTTGGATSHVAILARSLGLPAIAGIDLRALDIPDGTEVVLDGDHGELRLNPPASEIQLIRERQREHAERRKAALASSARTATTRDGHTIEVAANIGGVEDARKSVEMGCDGVGLLRSEFLFLERTTAPTEEEQYQVYQEIADVLGPRPLTIRTLDVGGDKPLQYLPIPTEENPFLGVRGVRVGLRNPEILREQLRAILRVKTTGTLNVMFPMIAMVEEFREAKAMLEEERQRLGAPPVKVGIMIEVPSAALMADAFAEEVDFFSIGTNDLTQYTLAMDRGHKDLAKQVDGLHPSVLKLIEMTVKAAHAKGKWVGVCGGIASDPKAVPFLIGLGVDELSVSIPVIPLVKSQVRDTTLEAAETFAIEAVFGARTAKDVRDMKTETGRNK